MSINTFAITALPIEGYKGRSLKNRFFRQKEGTDHLVILLPGYGYNPDMPLLYYLTDLFVEKGADLLQVHYGYDEVEGFTDLPGEERTKWIVTEVAAAARAALAQGTYKRITLLGKSIGTLSVAYLVTTLEPLRNAECIWLTPLVRDERFREHVKTAAPRSLFIIGTADQHYDENLLREVVEATGGKEMVVEGANHSMDIPNDLEQSLDILHRIVKEVDSFLG